LVTKDGNEYYFEYSATLRIFGQNLDHEAITATLRLEPTYTHKQGDFATYIDSGGRVRTLKQPNKFDTWQYKSPIESTKPLVEHIEYLWEQLKAHKEYLLELKKYYSVDVYCAYESDSGQAGIEIPYTCLEMFTELQIPFGVSILLNEDAIAQNLLEAKKWQKRIKYKK